MLSPRAEGLGRPVGKSLLLGLEWDVREQWHPAFGQVGRMREEGLRPEDGTGEAFARRPTKQLRKLDLARD